MKILLTNWINILGVFVGAMVCTVILTLADPNYGQGMAGAILGALFLVLGYGMMFWGVFIVSLLILDLILIVPSHNYLRTKLILEWVIIDIPFIYWSVAYKEWVFAAGAIAFLITQLLREKLICRIKS